MENNNILSKVHIDQLFDFVASKNVVYKDVQCEVVDHLASAIEDEMLADSSLTFDQGLKKVYSRFPITGFAVFVGGKQDAMAKYWFKKSFGIFLQYLTIPKIIGTTALFMLIYFAIILYGKYSLIPLYAAIVVGAFMHFLFYRDFREKKMYEQYLVLENYHRFTTNFSFAGAVYFIVFSRDIMFDMLPSAPLLVTFLFTILIVYFHACLTSFPQLLRKEINSKYHHLGIELNF